jgi:hypothetical protein
MENIKQTAEGLADWATELKTDLTRCNMLIDGTLQPNPGLDEEMMCAGYAIYGAIQRAGEAELKLMLWYTDEMAKEFMMTPAAVVLNVWVAQIRHALGLW